MLKRKMKGVAVDQSPYGASEDSKSRFRHQALLQDFHDLKKETYARRNHLEKVKLKKITLLAEVQFLRHRYQFLLNNQPLTPPPPHLQETEHPQKKQKKSDASSRRNKKDKNVSGKHAASRPPIPSVSSGQKEKNYSGKIAASRQPRLAFDLNRNESMYGTKDAAELQPLVHSGKEVALKNSPILDLNQKDDKAYSGKEAASSNPITAIDLNQISREDEEFQCDPDPTSMIRGGSDEPQLLDMKSSACRNSSGNASSRARKRKISWQDQMAGLEGMKTVY